MNRTRSKDIFEEARQFIPGGVNSPVRAFKAVGGNPVFIKKASGAIITDEDNNEYIDLINSWGPMILGHALPAVEEAVKFAASYSLSFGAPTEMEVSMAKLLVSMVPSMDMVRMVNSGTEATMSAIRVARGFSGKDKIIKFDGCYHGHGDSFLIAAGSGAITMGTPDSPGVTKGTAKDTLIARYNDLESVERLLKSNKGEIAAIIVEPVAGNMGCVLPNEEFLPGLRKLCDEYEVLLIFDEVMTGFRLAVGGAQEVFKVRPDLTTLGKIIGGGMPVGAYGGKREIMQSVSPVGPVYQAGTLSGNPVAMNAGFTLLSYLNENPQVYSDLDSMSEYIVQGIRNNLNHLGLQFTLNRIGSMFTLFFTDQKVVDFDTAKSCNLSLFGNYFGEMLDRGIYLAPSQFESLFLSTAVDKTLADRIINANLEVLTKLKG